MLEEQYEPHIDVSDLRSDDPNREQKTLSRALAALAINMVSGAQVEDACDAVTDGFDDNGIDALHYDPVSSTLTFVQAKFGFDGKKGVSAESAERSPRFAHL